MSRAEWTDHPNFPGPASTLLMIHDQFRIAAERLVLMIEREPEVGWVRRAFGPLATTLHHHHHAEEAMLFPFVERRTGTAPAELVSDHGELTEAIDAVLRDVNFETMTAFRHVLVEHLDREEALVIPVLLELSPSEAWSMIHAE